MFSNFSFFKILFIHFKNWWFPHILLMKWFLECFLNGKSRNVLNYQWFYFLVNWLRRWFFKALCRTGYVNISVYSIKRIYFHWIEINLLYDFTLLDFTSIILYFVRFYQTFAMYIQIWLSFWAFEIPVNGKVLRIVNIWYYSQTPL